LKPSLLFHRFSDERKLRIKANFSRHSLLIFL